MTKYTEKDISHFKRDTDKVRAKPNMYIGPNDEYGIYTILREVLDNGVDEARAGRNDSMRVWVCADGSFVVADNGVGIPVGKHKTAKISTLTHILTNLQSSGKMKGDAYKSSIGTHGVGLKATNALSDHLQVWTYRKDSGGWHTTEFKKGRETKKVIKGKPMKLPDGTTPKSGTVVRFIPDATMFTVKHKPGKVWFSVLPPNSLLHTWAEMTSYMNAKLKIEVNVFTPKDTKKYSTTKYYAKDGIKTYMAKRLEQLKATPFKKQQVEYHSDSMELALSFADAEGDNIEYFTNTVRNVDRGVHAEDFNRAIYDALKPFMGKQTFTPTDVRDGLVGVLNYKIDAPAFSSQTKEKLVDQRVKGACHKEALHVLSKFFKENKTLAQEWCKRAAELRNKTNAFLADKKLIKGVKNAGGAALAAKLSAIANSSKVPINERELYLVEGDSAGGTAKQARDNTFQATFATQGKPLNVAEASSAQIHSNKEIIGLLAGIGLDLSKKVPLDSLHYGRIIYLTDPDVDGKHINCLFSAIWWKFAPGLFKAGRIYTIKAPEYMAKHKGKYIYGSSKQSVKKKAGSDKVDIRHIKGWGEVPVPVLRELAFDPKTRNLVRILPPKDKSGGKRFEALMGKNAEFRKKLLGVA